MEKKLEKFKFQNYAMTKEVTEGNDLILKLQNKNS